METINLEEVIQEIIDRGVLKSNIDIDDLKTNEMLRIYLQEILDVVLDDEENETDDFELMNICVEKIHNSCNIYWYGEE